MAEAIIGGDPEMPVQSHRNETLRWFDSAVKTEIIEDACKYTASTLLSMQMRVTLLLISKARRRERAAFDCDPVRVWKLFFIAL
jgi:hypothetical protein